MESRCFGCCGSCCCVSRMGMVAYCGIFLGGSLLGLFHFAPVVSANHPFTFMMSAVVDDAEALCAPLSEYAWGIHACEFLCRCGDEPCDMKALASTMEGSQLFIFVIQLLSLGVYALGLVAALMRDTKKIKIFIICTAFLIFLSVIAHGAWSASDWEPVQAQYMYNALVTGDIDDDEVECTQDWKDDSDKLIVLSIISRWVQMLIVFVFQLHMMYTAHCARQDIIKGHSTGTYPAPPGVAMGAVATATAVQAVPVATAVSVTAVPTPAVAVAAPAGGAGSPPIAMAVAVPT